MSEETESGHNSLVKGIEIYNLLAKNLITKYDENNKIQASFQNLKEIELKEASSKLIEEYEPYTSLIVINPKIVLKRPSLIGLDLNQNEETIHLLDDFKDINIAHVSIVSCKHFY